MHSVISINDDEILAVNCGKGGLGENLVYRDENGIIQTIDFALCAQQYREEKDIPESMCIGERKADEGYFLFYTDNLKSRVTFRRRYIGPWAKNCCLKGTRMVRFYQLQKLINKAQYTTYDLS